MVFLSGKISQWAFIYALSIFGQKGSLSTGCMRNAASHLSREVIISLPALA
jgi:hypothetical protein